MRRTEARSDFMPTSSTLQGVRKEPLKSVPREAEALDALIVALGRIPVVNALVFVRNGETSTHLVLGEGIDVNSRSQDLQEAIKLHSDYIGVVGETGDVLSYADYALQRREWENHNVKYNAAVFFRSTRASSAS